jgi:DNA-binding protein HU-beta
MTEMEAWAEAVATAAGISKQCAKRVIKTIARVTHEKLAAGVPVRLHGIGVLETRRREARDGRNPKTGEKVFVPASVAVKFRASEKVKKAVNGTANA